MMKRKITSREIALSGLFVALALIVGLIENMIPPILPMLPYVKIGFSNIVLLFAFIMVGTVNGCLILVLKCLLLSLFAGNISSLLWSLPSALVAYAIMILLTKIKYKNAHIFSIIAISAVGGMLHNIMQMLVASIIIGKSVLVYLPYMLLAGGLCGLITGICIHFLVVRLYPSYFIEINTSYQYNREIESTQVINEQIDIVEQTE